MKLICVFGDVFLDHMPEFQKNPQISLRYTDMPPNLLVEVPENRKKTAILLVKVLKNTKIDAMAAVLEIFCRFN